MSLLFIYSIVIELGFFVNPGNTQAEHCGSCIVDLIAAAYVLNNGRHIDEIRTVNINNPGDAYSDGTDMAQGNHRDIAVNYLNSNLSAAIELYRNYQGNEEGVQHVFNTYADYSLGDLSGLMDLINNSDELTMQTILSRVSLPHRILSLVQDGPSKLTDVQIEKYQRFQVMLQMIADDVSIENMSDEELKSRFESVDTVNISQIRSEYLELKTKIDNIKPDDIKALDKVVNKYSTIVACESMSRSISRYLLTDEYKQNVKLVRDDKDYSAVVGSDSDNLSEDEVAVKQILEKAEGTLAALLNNAEEAHSVILGIAENNKTGRAIIAAVEDMYSQCSDALDNKIAEMSGGMSKRQIQSQITSMYEKIYGKNYSDVAESVIAGVDLVGTAMEVAFETAIATGGVGLIAKTLSYGSKITRGESVYNRLSGIIRSQKFMEYSAKLGENMSSSSRVLQNAREIIHSDRSIKFLSETAKEQGVSFVADNDTPVVETAVGVVVNDTIAAGFKGMSGSKFKCLRLLGRIFKRGDEANRFIKMSLSDIATGTTVSLSVSELFNGRAELNEDFTLEDLDNQTIQITKTNDDKYIVKIGEDSLMLDSIDQLALLDSEDEDSHTA